MSAETARAEALEQLRELRDRMLPMLREVAKEYDSRTEAGYPVVVDNVEDGGYFGISLDPGYGLYILTDGEQVLAQLHVIGWRNDVRSSANREKFTSLPVEGVRPVSPSMSNAALRNLISELLADWNTQPLIIHVTDS